MKKSILIKATLVLSISFLLFLVVGHGVVLADDYYVNAGLGVDDPIHGGSPETGAWKTITYALGQVTGAENNPTTINVAAGTYNPPDESFPLNMESYVSLQGAGRDMTVIDAEGSNGGVVHSDSVSNYYVDGLTITNGGDPGWGPGFHCLSSSPTISNCIISFNGKGIYNIDSSPTINNCIIEGNFFFGGGGGITNLNGSSPIITNCIFQSNVAEGPGGAIANSNSSPILKNCIFIENYTLWDPDGGGGAISNSNSSPHIINCSFFGNYTLEDAPGGAIFNSNSSPTITNCILWGDNAPEGSEIYNAEGSNPIITFSNIDQDGYGNPDGSADTNGNIRLDPLFVDPYDVHLQSGSPCIDTGTNVGAPSDDIDGDLRPLGLGIDIGADEYVPMCQGLADYDSDVDGTDASMFKTHFGRSTFGNPCPPNGPAPVPKTGQTISYATGDDGDLERGVTLVTPRFTDNGDGTVTDNQTGLIWLKNANCFGLRNWNNAISDCNGLADGACGLSDGSNAGDWRLPNKKELISLTHDAYYNPPLPNTAGTGQWSEGDPFTSVLIDYYWSGTTLIFDTVYAWVVYMSSGYVDYSSKPSNYNVWPVRGGH